MSGRGTLLVVERVLGDRTTPAELDHYRADLLMAIATPGGKERTRREFEAREGFRLTLGNAGGVRVTVDGRALEPLGQAGQVVRNLPLPADRQG